MTTDALPVVDYTPRIRDLPAGERPRERLLQYGASALSNAELIAILLRTGVEGESALGVAQRLLAHFGGLRGIGAAAYGELSREKGLSAAKYCHLMAAMELGRRLASTSPQDQPVIRTAQDVADLLMGELAHLDQEHLRVVLLSSKNQVQGVHRVYIGTVNTSLVRASEVFRPAVRENSPAIIVAHNHPSGDPTPSQQDIQLTRQLCQAGRVLNVDLMDHVVIGCGQFVSMKERGLGFE
ncbi:MAG: DNA repair protein RadC [Dehalococcoidia bacterium]